MSDGSHLDKYKWKPGESGNPNGYSRSRRITDRLARLIEDHKFDDEIATAWLGAALGDERLLRGRKPSAAFFAMLLDRIEGPPPTDRDGGEPLKIIVEHVNNNPDGADAPSGPDDDGGGDDEV